MFRNITNKPINFAAGIKQSLSIFACLLVLLSQASPGFTQAVGNEKVQLEQYEQIMFGHPHPGALEDRLKGLESALFGKSKKGDMATRLSAIGKALGANNTASIAPASEEIKDKAPLTQRGQVSLSEDKIAQVADLLKQGMEQFNQGKLMDAESSFDEVLAIDPNNADAFFDLGVLKEKQGNLQAALQDYKSAQDLKPDEKDIQDAVVSLTQKLNDRQPAHSRTQPASYQAVPYSPYTEAPVPPPVLTSNNIQAEKPKGKGSGIAKAVIGVCAAAAVGVALSGAMHGGGGFDIGCPICRLLHAGL